MYLLSSGQTYPDIMIVLSILVLAVIILYPVECFENAENEDKSLMFLLVFGLCFVVAILAEGFLVYFLILSKSSFIKQFLSAKFLIPIGRLSYGIYLLNPLVNWFNIQQNWDTPRLTLQYLVSDYSFNTIDLIFEPYLHHLFLECSFCIILL